MLGEMVVDEELPSDWREALTLIARAHPGILFSTTPG